MVNGRLLLLLLEAMEEPRLAVVPAEGVNRHRASREESRGEGNDLSFSRLQCASAVSL